MQDALVNFLGLSAYLLIIYLGIGIFCLTLGAFAATLIYNLSAFVRGHGLFANILRLIFTTAAIFTLVVVSSITFLSILNSNFYTQLEFKKQTLSGENK